MPGFMTALFEKITLGVSSELSILIPRRVFVHELSESIIKSVYTEPGADTPKQALAWPP
jgi:hypothetical protein